MIPVKHIDPDDIALYAMQLLPAGETEEMGLNLQHSAEGRRALAEVYSDLSVFAHSVEMHTPSANARARFMQQVASEKRAAPVSSASAVAEPAIAASDSETYTPRATVVPFGDAVARRSTTFRIVPWIGWAIAAGLGFFAVSLYQQQSQMKSTLAVSRIQLTASEAALADAQTDLRKTQVSADVASTVLDTIRNPAAVHFTLTGSAVKPPPQGRVSYIASRGSLVLLASNLNILPPDKAYELWLIPAGGSAPIPAGVFRPDARGFASVVLPKLPRGVAASAFGITVENGEGAQAPTLPIILKGTPS